MQEKLADATCADFKTNWGLRQNRLGGPTPQEWVGIDKILEILSQVTVQEKEKCEYYPLVRAEHFVEITKVEENLLIKTDQNYYLVNPKSLSLITTSKAYFNYLLLEVNGLTPLFQEENYSQYSAFEPVYLDGTEFKPLSSGTSVFIDEGETPERSEEKYVQRYLHGDFVLFRLGQVVIDFAAEERVKSGYTPFAVKNNIRSHTIRIAEGFSTQ